jgi:hypothetical protein
MPNLTGKPLTNEEKDTLIERWSKSVTAIRELAAKLGMMVSFHLKDGEMQYDLLDQNTNDVITSGDLVYLKEFLDRCPKLKAFL